MKPRNETKLKTRIFGMALAVAGIGALGVAAPVTASAHATCSYHREYDYTAMGWRYNVPFDTKTYPAQRLRVCRVVTTVDGVFSGKHVIGNRWITETY